jgi:hypothetical protein
MMVSGVRPGGGMKECVATRTSIMYHQDASGGCGENMLHA